MRLRCPRPPDSDFSWGEFHRRNNDELVATWGNLVNRVLSLINRHFDGQVPDPGPLDRDATRMLDRAQSGLEQVGQSIEGVHLRQGIQQAFALAQETNATSTRLRPGRPSRLISRPQHAASTPHSA